MTTRNYSLFTVPAVVLATCVGPHAYALCNAPKLYNNNAPRAFNEAIEKSESLDKATKARLLRAQGASDNSFETLGFFASAVAVGNFAGLDHSSLNFLSIGYLATRMSYCYVYIHLQDYKGFHILRSIFWETAFVMASALWIKAGFRLLKK